jgi:multidrug efflux pump subunit AcrA (membrane-fusion protein)
LKKNVAASLATSVAARSRFALLAISLLLALAAGGTWYAWRGTAGEPSYRSALVQRGPLQAAIVARGTLNAIDTVAVGAPISGQIAEILVDFKTPVKQGQLLARLDAAQSDPERANVRAPVDGTIVLRNVEVGQPVVAGLQATALFAIARDLRRVQVEVALGAADAARLQPATFTVEALPRRSFSGELQRLRKGGAGPDGAAFAATIAAENPDQLLLPGMAASVRMVVQNRDGVLKIPNAALSFLPDGVPATGAPRVWIRHPEGGLRPIAVRTGISDESSTEILEGPLKEGDTVILGTVRRE